MCVKERIATYYCILNTANSLKLSNTLSKYYAHGCAQQ